MILFAYMHGKQGFGKTGRQCLVALSEHRKPRRKANEVLYISSDFLIQAQITSLALRYRNDTGSSEIQSVHTGIGQEQQGALYNYRKESLEPRAA